MSKFKKISRWFKYNPPAYLSFNGWKLFDQEFKEKAPVRYSIKKALRFLRRMRYRLVSVPVSNFKVRFINRYHILDTGLPPGIHDFDIRLLHSAFNEFSKFLEDVYVYRWVTAEKLMKRNLFNRQKVREHTKQVILKYYETEKASTLMYQQRKTHLELLELYEWWEVKRPGRKDSIPKYSDQGFKNGRSNPKFDRDAPDYQAYIQYMRDPIRNKKEDDEDTEMLVRLVKIRHDLYD